MKVYLAPLEGITGWICRNAIKECFGGFDKYFVPFIKPNQKGHFSSREKKDVMSEHNIGMDTVPQILTNNVEDFLRTAEKLREYGYEEVNLNLGCPSRTVVTKGRGAGFLADPDRLDAFLDARRLYRGRTYRRGTGADTPQSFRRRSFVVPGYIYYYL